jgi:hypothetical protein
MSPTADGWVRWTTTGCGGLLALIAGTVSYLHMHTLIALHGQPGWVAALTPLSVDGMIVAASTTSTTLLAGSRSARKFRRSAVQQVGDDIRGAEAGARKSHKFGQEVESLAESDQHRLGGFIGAPLG